MRKIVLIACAVLSLAGCHQNHTKPNYLKIGTIAGPETELMEVAANIANQKFKLTVDFVTFTDYVSPNQALADKSIDANAFQHQPYLDAAIENKGYPFVVLTKTFIFPMGVYSKKHTSLKQLQSGAIVAIQNDPSNQARALLLLEKAGLIKTKDPSHFNQTIDDIKENPLKLVFKTLDAAQLPRSLADVDIATINTNYALPAGLVPSKDALFLEDKNSPYANLIVVRKGEEEREEFKHLVTALHSQEVATKANELFEGQAYPAW